MRNRIASQRASAFGAEHALRSSGRLNAAELLAPCTKLARLPARNFLHAFGLVTLALAFHGVAWGLQPAKIFSDRMVLQCDASVPVWGQAAPHANVTVEFDGHSTHAVVDASGRWRVDLPPMKASGEGRSMTIHTNQDRVELRDVVVGEVWFAGGQSNMQQTMGSTASRLDEGAKMVDTANYPLIRYRKVTEKNAATPQMDLHGGEWTACSPKSVANFSAAGFVFARRLHLELNVPVGVIDCSWGGTPIEPYIPAKAFVGHPTLEQIASLARTRDIEGIRNLAGGTLVRSDAWLPGQIYNGRIAPVAPYGIRGAIWYQGESNSGKGEDPRAYEHKMRALIAGWRDAWEHDRLPFYFVQLPQWKSYGWTYLREEQRRAMAVRDTGMAVTLDLDNGDDIHPPNKIDVGERLALWPLAKIHKQDVQFSGPLYRECRIDDDFVEVQFDHAADGLMVGQSGVGTVTETPERELNGFEVADRAGHWHRATAAIAGSSVRVSCPGVTPVAVRYACHPSAPKERPWNLYNKAGLPASPFCSDWTRMPYDPPEGE